MSDIDKLETLLRAITPGSSDAQFSYAGPAPTKGASGWTATARIVTSRSIETVISVGWVGEKPSHDVSVGALLAAVETVARQQVAAITAALGEESTTP